MDLLQLTLPNHYDMLTFEFSATNSKPIVRYWVQSGHSANVRFAPKADIPWDAGSGTVSFDPFVSQSKAMRVNPGQHSAVPVRRAVLCALVASGTPSGRRTRPW